MDFVHIPILLRPCMEALRIRPAGCYVDATTGGAGHSLCIAQQLEGGRLLCIDRDEEALAHAKDKLSGFSCVTMVQSDFRAIDRVLAEQQIDGADGILFDLGVSSPQLDHAERGFTYQKEAPLDMRMDRRQSLTASAIVNHWPVGELRRILLEYGEERYASRIAAAIGREREKKPITTTLELSDLIRSAMPARALREKQHPAKRSFMAIRIAVNDELGALREAMEKAIACLRPAGRLAVITFHSLEDRIVKNAFRQAAQGCTCPKEFPVCVCGKKPVVRLTPRGPLLPDQTEIRANPRARSAKLRVCEKL